MVVFVAEPFIQKRHGFGGYNVQNPLVKLRNMHPSIFPQQVVEFHPNLFEQGQFLEVRSQAFKQHHLAELLLPNGFNLNQTST